jgi:hypothetical protein
MSNQFSLPLGSARLERPSSVFRYTFRHFVDAPFRDRRKDLPSERGIVPIEAVAPGDVQVLAAREPTNPKIPVIDLDVLSDFPSVESLVVSAQIRATRDLPHIRELLLTHVVSLPDAATLKRFTGLQTLFALPVACSGRLDLDAIPAEQMRDLAVSHWFTKSLAPLERMTSLRQLRADLFRDRLDAVSKMPQLTFLNIRGPANAWAKLRECAMLEEAHLIDVHIANLRRWNTWKRLHSLVLSGRGVKSLAGLESSENLSRLTLLNLDMSELAPLRDLPHLQKLTLRMVAKSADLVSVAAIPRLRSLTIEDAAVADVLDLPTLKPLARAAELEELSLHQVAIEDGDLMPLAALPKLRRVRLGSTIGADVETLRAARPDIEIDHTPPDPKWQALMEKVGSVTIQKPGDGLKQWSIFQSFAPAFNLQTNYAAESRIQKEISKRDPDLAKRLEWDTEAGAVGIYANSESDIRSVAAILNEIFAFAGDDR